MNANIKKRAIPISIRSSCALQKLALLGFVPLENAHTSNMIMFINGIISTIRVTIQSPILTGES